MVAWGYGFVSGYLGWQALGWRVALWLLLLVAENWEGGFSYRKAYFVLALSLGVEAIVGIGQYAGLWQGNGQFRVTGTFENPAGLAAYSAICFPFALYFLPERGKRLFGGGVALLAVAAVALSGSRSGIAALVAVGLGDRLEHRSNQMSGGQMQRVAIARALVNDPAVILADEATGNLDTRTSFEILVLFQKLHAEGRTIIFVTHNPDIAQYSSRNIRLRDGHVIEDRVNCNILSASETLSALPAGDDE